MGCIRSNGNYPHLLAKAVQIGQLVDVSCSGATTHDLASRMPLFEGGTLPPQDNALTRSTDLVTVGIGGNDNGLFATILSTCRQADGCGISAELPELTATVDRLGPTLVAVLHRVRVRAPKAKILLIGYPKIAPDRGGCAQLPQLAATNLGTINEVNLQLNNVMRAAARTAHVGFINVYQASRGHDICSPSPWVNGTTTDVSAALALHPFAREQIAVARLIQNRIMQ
ncbi:MAG: Lipase 2 precursor [Marmoricola sp.]|nr:Lipase 2 precursor [Marmoricola sp.]